MRRRSGTRSRLSSTYMADLLEGSYVNSHAAVATADGWVGPVPGRGQPALSDGCYGKDEGEAYCRCDEQKA